MIRQKTIGPAVLLTLLFGLGGCATHARPGEPTPKDIIPYDQSAPPSEGPKTTPLAEEATKPAEAPKAPATESAKTAPTPPPAEASPPPAALAEIPLVPSDKPRIVAKVESAQSPVWVERGGVKAAVKAGWAIYSSDLLTTGSDGRLTLATVGEGILKLAGNTQLEMTRAYEATGGPEPPLASLQRGTITFAAPMVRPGLPGLPITVRESILATVMGGQVVMQANPDDDVLALIDGYVQVSGPKLNPGSMKTANTFLRIPRNGRAAPVSESSQASLARWVSAAEPIAGKPTLDAAGTWDVSLNSGYNLKLLEGMACRIQNSGYPSEIYPVREPGKQVWYRVVVRRFKSKNDAVDFLGTAKRLGSREPWVLIPG